MAMMFIIFCQQMIDLLSVKDYNAMGKTFAKCKCKKPYCQIVYSCADVIVGSVIFYLL